MPPASPGRSLSRLPSRDRFDSARTLTLILTLILTLTLSRFPAERYPLSLERAEQERHTGTPSPSPGHAGRRVSFDFPEDLEVEAYAERRRMLNLSMQDSP